MVMRSQDLHDHPGDTVALPSLADPAGWLAVASGQAALRVCRAKGRSSESALRLDYDFGGGGGFVVARREVVLELAESWEIAFFIRGEAPRNTLEVKLVNDAGTSVWRWKCEAFDPSQEWTRLHVESRDTAFAWGPAGGGSLGRTSALEIAVVAAPGGSGFLELTDFVLIDRSLGRALGLSASSSRSGDSPAFAAGNAVDGNLATTWRSEPSAGPHSLTMDFGALRELGGLIIEWDAAAQPKAFRVEAERDTDVWETVYDAARAGAPISFVGLPAVSARRLRVSATALDHTHGVGIADLQIKPIEWSRTPSEFLTSVALASKRGAWPRYLLREQSYWTPVGAPHSGPVGLLNDDGAVEIGEGGFLLEPSVLVPTDGGAPEAKSWMTWAEATRTVRLESPPLPVATAALALDGLSLEVTAVAEDCCHPASMLMRYRLRSSSARMAKVTLLVALRPLQVTPPWQEFRSLGGPSPIRKIAWTNLTVCINEAVTVRPLSECTGFYAAAFDEGGVAGSLAQGCLPSHTNMADPSGRAEGVFAFEVALDLGATCDVFIDCRFVASTPSDQSKPAPLPKGEPASLRQGEPASLRDGEPASLRDSEPASLRDSEPASLRDSEPARPAGQGDAAGRMNAAIESWRCTSPVPTLTVSAMQAHTGPIEAYEVAATAIAHILLCRDGAALQPGPRRYTRSWIRDGAIMASGLLRAGLFEDARAFVRWYAPFQRGDGFVPCCVDREGVDWLVEHDSHGQLIYAIAEYFRFTRDLEFVRSMWRYCTRAATFIEALRLTRKTAEFETGYRRACFGLLPESVSHEGYLAQPVHSYWDDFWALRGLRDTAFLADALGLDAEAERWKAAADDLGAAISTSMDVVMQERGLVTVPASVEWADFDPTAVSGAISLVGATAMFPADALARTFDEYLQGFRARRDGSIPWNNYTPYEVRIVGALVHLGRRDDANDLLDHILAARRPAAWNQWPEIVWHDPESPAHLGDLPHCWIGSEYVIALRTMLVYEREDDGALVIGAGLRREWIDTRDGLVVKGIPTWYGVVDLEIRRDAAGGYRVLVGGDADPPGGFVAELPGGLATVEVT